MLKKIGVILFLYLCYGLRMLVSAICNIVLFLIYAFRRDWQLNYTIFKQKIDELKLHNITYNNIIDVLDSFYKNNFNYSYFSIIFTIYPKLFVSCKFGDCLSYSTFIKFYFNYLSMKQDTFKYKIEIRELISIKPMVKYNHAFVKIKVDNNKYRIFTPYNYISQEFSSDLEIITFFEKLNGCEYIKKLFPIW